MYFEYFVFAKKTNKNDDPIPPSKSVRRFITMLLLYGIICQIRLKYLKESTISFCILQSWGKSFLMVLFTVCKMYAISLQKCKRRKWDFPSSVYFWLFVSTYCNIRVNNSVIHYSLGATCPPLHGVQDDRRLLHFTVNGLGLSQMMTIMHTYIYKYTEKLINWVF